MIFYLTDSLRGDDTYLQSIKHELHNLAYSAIEGSHYLTGDLDILTDCIDLFKGDKEVTGFFRYLCDNWYSMPVPTCVTYYMEVVKDNPSVRVENGVTIAQRPIKHFAKMGAVSPCLLVCENDRDCDFYQFVGDWYVKRNKVNACIGFEAEGSGGCEEAKNKIHKHLMKNQFCLCILDSDIRYPGDNINDKSLKCHKTYKNRDDCRCIILDVRELENLIPLNYIDEITKEHPDYQQPVNQDYVRHFNFLRDSNRHQDILPYFDYKEGIRKNINYKGSSEFQAFSKLCWEQNPELSTGLSYQEYEDSISEGDRMYLPLARKIHAHTIDYINKHKVAGTLKDPVLLPFQEAEWKRIGKELATWGYAKLADAIS